MSKTERPEPKDVAREVGRGPRIVGAILIVLALAIGLRVAWLGAMFGESFDSIEWVRFSFWLCMCVTMALVGVWLRYRARKAAWGALAIFTLFCVTIFCLDFMSSRT